MQVLLVWSKTTWREGGLGSRWAELAWLSVHNREERKKLFPISIFCFQNLLHCFELLLVFKLLLDHIKYGMDLSTYITRSTYFCFEVLNTFQNRRKFGAFLGFPLYFQMQIFLVSFT
jgi:hypothetical protein